MAFEIATVTDEQAQRILNLDEGHFADLKANRAGTARLNADIMEAACGCAANPINTNIRFRAGRQLLQ